MHTRTRAHPREIRQRVLTPSTERKSHPARHRNGWWSFGLHDGLLSVNEGVISRWGSRRAEVAVSRPREKFPSRSGRLAEPGVELVVTGEGFLDGQSFEVLLTGGGQGARRAQR